LQCNRGCAPNALATCFLLIAAGILGTPEAQFEGGTRVPATVSAIADANWVGGGNLATDRRAVAEQQVSC
jgi:hypothetical protein